MTAWRPDPDRPSPHDEMSGNANEPVDHRAEEARRADHAYFDEQFGLTGTDGVPMSPEVKARYDDVREMLARRRRARMALRSLQAGDSFNYTTALLRADRDKNSH